MRLIDADALKKPIYAEEDNITGSGMGYGEMEGYNDGINVTWSRIINAPTVDAVPVIHGEWIDTCDFETCSVCKGTHFKTIETIYGKVTWIKSKYCPNCGAKMDGERRTE